jgi:hypothetical protein
MSKYQDALNYQKACWNMKLNSQPNFRPTHLKRSFNVLQEALNELEGTKQRLKRYFDILRDEEYWRDVRLIEEVTTLREELEKGSGSEYVKELLDRIEDLKEKLYGNDDE